MADENSGGNSWWDTFVSAAKTKSVEVLEFMKKDIEEFSTAIKNEASTIANQTSAVVKETLQLDNDDSPANNVKKSVSSFFDTVKEALNPSPSTEFDEAMVIHDGNPVSMTKLQKKIHSLTSEDSTYLDAVGPEEAGRFDAWLSVNKEVLENVDRLGDALCKNPLLMQKYEALVPGQINHSEFWERYLFRKALLEDLEAELERKQEREKRLAEAVHWDKEDFSEDVMLTEEEQTRLIAEYEMEKKKKTLVMGEEVQEKEAQNSFSYIVKEKRDMVVVGPATDVSQTSSSSKASTDGDWEKEFDMEDAEPEPK